MRDNTTFMIQTAITHLSVYRTEIDTAIAALEAVLGHRDMVVPQEANTAPARPVATRKAKATAKTTSPRLTRVPAANMEAETPDTHETPDTPDTHETPDTPDTHETPDTPGRAKFGEWQERALKALSMGPGDVQVRELVTRLRVKGPDRDTANQRIWGALQALVRSGQVVKNGPRYRLAKAEAA
jgi:hypothetical protein